MPNVWPTATDYRVAVQSPQNVFDDAELKTTQPKMTALQLPVCASGNFATVFRMQGAAGKDFAVRCFTKPIAPDQRQRYAEITKHFTGVALAVLVGFDYLIKGVEINRQWYPALKMDWVKAKRLDTVVEDSLTDPKALEAMAAKWRTMMEALRQAHVSHCDLQQGNVLVTAGGDYVLIDYDGVWVPALKGTDSGENGHPAYQHPQRMTAGYYEENTDSFSALVVYLSLLALKSDPSLFPSFNTGDNLVFTSGDYKRPGKTPIWARLKSSADAEVVRLTAELEKFCTWPVANVPDLEAVLASNYAPPAGGVTYVPTVRKPRPVIPTAVPVTRAPVAAPPPPAMAQLAACPNCGTASRAGSKFCAKCGYGVTTIPCPHCNRVTAVRTFCAHCGQRL